MKKIIRACSQRLSDRGFTVYREGEQVPGYTITPPPPTLTLTLITLTLTLALALTLMEITEQPNPKP